MDSEASAGSSCVCALLEARVVRFSTLTNRGFAAPTTSEGDSTLVAARIVYRLEEVWRRSCS